MRERKEGFVAGAPHHDNNEIDLTRLLNLSDGIFSIAMNLLVFSISLPELRRDTDAELARQVIRLLPKVLLLAVSFLLIARYRQLHHEVFRRIRRGDQRLMQINMLFLLLVAILPLPVGLVGKYGQHPFANAIYAGVMVVTTLTLFGLIWYAISTPGTLHKPIDTDQIRRSTLRYLLVPGIFALSIPLAYLNVRAAWLCWLLAALIKTKLARHAARRAR